MAKLEIKIESSIARELNINHDKILTYIKSQKVRQELLEPLRDEWEARNRCCD